MYARTHTYYLRTIIIYTSSILLLLAILRRINLTFLFTSIAFYIPYDNGPLTLSPTLDSLYDKIFSEK